MTKRITVVFSMEVPDDDDPHRMDNLTMRLHQEFAAEDVTIVRSRRRMIGGHTYDVREASYDPSPLGDGS